MSNDFREYSAAFYATNNDLLHYGVMGMKWGVRRAKRYEGNGEDARNMQKHLRKNAKYMVRNERAMEIAKKIMSKTKKGTKKYDKWAKHYKEASASRDYARGEIGRIKKSANKNKVSIGSHRKTMYAYTPGEVGFALVGPSGLGVPSVLYNAYKKGGAERKYSKYVVRKKGKNKIEAYKQKRKTGSR